MSLKVPRSYKKPWKPFRFAGHAWKSFEGLVGRELSKELRGKVEEEIDTYKHWRKQGPSPSPTFTGEMMRYRNPGVRSQKTKEEDARILTGRWGKRAPGRPPDWKTGELCWLASRLYTHAREAGLRYAEAVVFTREILKVVLDREEDATMAYAVEDAVRDFRRRKTSHSNPL